MGINNIPLGYNKNHVPDAFDRIFLVYQISTAASFTNMTLRSTTPVVRSTLTMRILSTTPEGLWMSNVRGMAGVRKESVAPSGMCQRLKPNEGSSLGVSVSDLPRTSRRSQLSGRLTKIVSLPSWESSTRPTGTLSLMAKRNSIVSGASCSTPMFTFSPVEFPGFPLRKLKTSIANTSAAARPVMAWAREEPDDLLALMDFIMVHSSLMELDPHTLQLIIDRIEQQMRCPQCGKRIPVNMTSVRLAGDDFMLLQLECETCD